MFRQGSYIIMLQNNIHIHCLTVIAPFVAILDATPSHIYMKDVASTRNLYETFYECDEERE